MKTNTSAPSAVDPAPAAATGRPTELAAEAPELKIEFFFFGPGCVRIAGTKDQLLGEISLPPGIAWPKGDESAYWSVGEVQYRLTRHKPQEIKGTRRAWLATEPDSWILHSDPVRQFSAHEMAILRYERELAAIEARQRLPSIKAVVAAQFDERFQAALAAMLPPKKPRKARVSKAKEA